MRGAFRHVLADLAGSVGVIVAGLVVLATGWAYADPLVGLAIGVLVLAELVAVLRDSVRILLEATPSGIDAEEVGRALAAVESVVEVHDLHIWTITCGFPALSAHVLVEPGADCHAVRRRARARAARALRPHAHDAAGRARSGKARRRSRSATRPRGAPRSAHWLARVRGAGGTLESAARERARRARPRSSPGPRAGIGARP